MLGLTGDNLMGAFRPPGLHSRVVPPLVRPEPP